MAVFIRRLAGAFALGAGAALGFVGTAAVASHEFPDVPRAAQYHPDISWVTQHGISGNAPEFKPLEPLTRQQAARWFHKYSTLTTLHRETKPFASVTAATVVADCKPGETPVAAGGTTSVNNMFITDVALGSTGTSVRWETDNNAVASGTAQAWVMCQAAP